MTFRLEIQGLRAVAVIAVILFQLGLSGVPGGYIGVDVFFVISGFLITTQLAKESDRTGTIRLRDFYWRRTRRLMPALCVTTILTFTIAANFNVLIKRKIPLMCGEEKCEFMSSGTTLYVWDDSHWTLEGANLIMTRLIGAMSAYFASARS
jgi:hypothetical protein